MNGRRKFIKITLVLCFIVITFFIVWLFQAYQAECREQVLADELRQANIEYPFLDDNVVRKHFRGRDYYVAKKLFEGEHDIQALSYNFGDKVEQPESQEHKYRIGDTWFFEENHREKSVQGIKISQVMSFSEYVDFCEEWQLTQKYTNADMNYIVRSRCEYGYRAGAKLYGVKYEADTAILYIREFWNMSRGNEIAFVYIIPTEENVETIEVCYPSTEDEYKSVLEAGLNYPSDWQPMPE